MARRTSRAAFVKRSIGCRLVIRTAPIYRARYFEQCVRLCRIEAPLSGEFNAIHVECCAVPFACGSVLLSPE
jgi:hypothetical protein